MDFTLDEGQQAVADVIGSVLGRDGVLEPKNTWQALVDGGVTALGVPERLGGDGVGLAEITTALTERIPRSTMLEQIVTRCPDSSIAFVEMELKSKRIEPPKEDPKDKNAKPAVKSLTDAKKDDKKMEAKKDDKKMDKKDAKKDDKKK